MIITVRAAIVIKTVKDMPIVHSHVSFGVIVLPYIWPNAL